MSTALGGPGRFGRLWRALVRNLVGFVVLATLGERLFARADARLPAHQRRDPDELASGSVRVEQRLRFVSSDEFVVV